MKEELMDIINDLVDMGDCVYDYHGNCQAHGWFSDKECPHSRAKRVLANAIPISEAPDTKLARENCHNILKMAMHTCPKCGHESR